MKPNKSYSRPLKEYLVQDWVSYHEHFAMVEEIQLRAVRMTSGFEN